MSSKEVKDDRKYTTDHEWARSDDSNLVVGITAFAVDQLGDITLVSFDVAVGDHIEAGKTFGTIESVKTLSDLYAPISGTIAHLNDRLEEEPELVNDDCWGEGWMIALVPDDPAALEQLLDAAAYASHVEAADH